MTHSSKPDKTPGSVNGDAAGGAAMFTQTSARLRSSLSRLQNALPRWTLPFLAGVLCVLLLLGIVRWMQSPAPTTPLNATEAAENMTEASLRGRVDPAALPYEEALGGPLEESVKKIDFALLQAFAGLALHRSAVLLEEVETRLHNGQEYHFQRMRLYSTEPQKVAAAIADSLAAWVGNATLTPAGPQSFVISVNGASTHELALVASPAPPYTQGDETGISTTPDSGEPPSAESGATPATRPRPDPRPTPEGTGRLAIVIDDLGESVNAARKLASLSFPVTFAIWPRSTNAKLVAEIGRQRGEEIILHQPMEPIGYPEVRPGPGTVFVRMTPDQVHTIIAENLKMVPYAVGINNHMGSRFTQDRQAVQAVLEELRERDLFVLDSWTHSKSVFFAEAKKAGFTAYKRSVFIDVVQDVPSIVHQLEKAERIALTTGQAIAIGHPLPETLAALRQWEARRNPAVSVVPVRSLRPN